MSDAPISIRSDGVLERFVQHLHTADDWMPRVIESGLTYLGRQIGVIMRQQVSPHRYTGELEESITSEYSAAQMQVEIGPTAKRGGGHDAGVILEMGTRPIPNLPFEPIRKWAEFRGIEAGPVWASIRENGVKAHPFLDRTLAASEGEIENAAKTIADMAADNIVQTAGIV